MSSGANLVEKLKIFSNKNTSCSKIIIITQSIKLKFQLIF